MRIKNYILGGLLIIPMLWSCDKYEDYIKDYDYSAVYFGTQKPLRTLVAREEMKFKFGVALGGKRENNVVEKATFEIDPELLNTVEGADVFTLLPEDYYTLSNSGEFSIPVGKFIGDVTLTLDREKFTADPEAINNTYALPVKVTGASTDSVLFGKDYSIIVVKYISPYHGAYYSKGAEYTLDANGTPVDTTIFSNKDLSKNMVKEFSTQALNIISTSKIGATKSGIFEMMIQEDNSVELTSLTINIVENSSVYSQDEKTFYLDYKFEQSGTNYHTVDTLILRQDPELGLRFEEW